VATGVLVGNSLGSGRSLYAKLTSYIAIITAVAYMTLSAILMISLKDYIPIIFTNEENVINLASKIFPVAAAFQLFDGIGAVAGGIMRGSGRQKIGAAYIFVGFYVIGLPLGGTLGFVANLRLMGLWIGIAVALCCVSIFALILIFRTDWEHQVELARWRLQKNNSANQK